MRLIDADALKEQVESPYTEYPIMIQIRKALKDFIDAAPTIEPIQCGECIHHNAEISLCYYHNMPTTDGWFCADGERLVK